MLLAIITGLAVAAWWKMHLTGLRRIAGFAAFFILGEWVRGHILTGFPWNLTAHGWIGWPSLLQSYSFLGAYALGLLTIAAAATPALIGESTYPARRAYGAAAIGIACLAALAAWGAYRLSAALPATVPGQIVRLVQPNIPQDEKWSQQLAQRHFTTLLSLSRQPAAGDRPNVIVWPESAVPYFLDASPLLGRAIASALPPGGIALVGALRRVPRGEDWDYYNSLEAVDADGNTIAHYDKSHLAPFGEYMPLRSILPLDSMAVGSKDLSSGAGAVTMSVPDVPPFSPMICYEAIFPGTIVDESHRPSWLLQITNDGWFGKSAGPHQHFAMARARAVEQGLPLMRAANTGISGATDAYGRLLGFLPLETQGVLDVELTSPLPRAPFYARHGDLIFYVGEAGIFLSFFAKRRRFEK
jgi:apolipoprotein N-acyltransferase